MRVTSRRVKVLGFSGKGGRVGRMQQPIECGSEVGTKAWLGGPATHAILALGITQIIAWGTTLYALGVLGKPIAEDTGWSQSLVFGGLTTGLLVVSTLVGRGVDRSGGRGVMAVGSLLMAVGLTLLALVRSPPAYLLAWAFLGLAMRMCLYDAAFAALVQVTPSRGRRAISYLTLFGGFASSVFWPIAHLLHDAYGWRTTLVIFAALNLLLCAPLHWSGQAREPAAGPASPCRCHGLCARRATA
jgi:MFS family permease